MKKKIALLITLLTFSLSSCKFNKSSSDKPSPSDVTSTVTSSADESSETDPSESETPLPSTSEASVPSEGESSVSSEVSEPVSEPEASEPKSSDPVSEPDGTSSSSETEEPLPEFTVTFVTNAPTTLDPVVTSKLNYPPVITNEPNVLVGWFFEATFINIVSFPLLVTKDITLYAKWDEASDGLNYEINQSNTGYIITSYAGNQVQVVIPEHINNLPVVEIGEYAFYENGTVDHVTLPSTLITISFGAFKNATRIESMNFPTSLKTIASDAFSGASNLKNINLEATSLETLGDNSFERTMISNAKLPATIATIGARAFADNAKFTELTVNATTPPFVYHSSFDSTSLNKIKVPSNSVATYKNSPYWASYQSLIISL